MNFNAYSIKRHESLQHGTHCTFECQGFWTEAILFPSTLQLCKTKRRACNFLWPVQVFLTMGIRSIHKSSVKLDQSPWVTVAFSGLRAKGCETAAGQEVHQQVQGVGSVTMECRTLEYMSQTLELRQMSGSPVPVCPYTPNYTCTRMHLNALF